ncbi:MAG: RNA methyltransferase [Deltaproteobacteria bacterium]|nr:RNA methyltransferase [Deltaproteobacteria bacterium]
MARSIFQNHFHIVLVEPGNSLNIGAVARAMSNFGFANLHLVSPQNYKPDIAETAACWATDVLAGANMHDDLDSALAPMTQVVGFSAREGADRPRHLTLPEWVDQVAENLAKNLAENLAENLTAVEDKEEAKAGAKEGGEPSASQTTDNPGPQYALLFGPEDHGLERRHLNACRWLVRIPSRGANPSFNLSQSVLLALYEITRALGGAAVEHSTTHPHFTEPRVMPTQGEFSQLDKLVTEAGVRSRFLGHGTPRPIPAMVRHLFRRIDPDKRDMGILMGLFGKINRALEGAFKPAEYQDPEGYAEGEEPWRKEEGK